MTKSEVQKLVAMMAGVWDRPPVQPEKVEAYCFALADLDRELSREAVRSLMQTSRFFPTIAEIRERAVKNRVNLPTPEEAWGIVRRAIGTVGWYCIPEFDCDEVQDAVRAIGWQNMCVDDNEAATRARYIDAFKGMAAKRLHLEATGRYVMPERQLPSGTRPGDSDDSRVRVVTGYGTPRPQLLELEAADEQRRQIRQLKAEAGYEGAPPDDGSEAEVFDMATFKASYPSKRGA